MPFSFPQDQHAFAAPQCEPASAPPSVPKRTQLPKLGVLTIDDLRARSTRGPGDLCWHWQGAMSGYQPRIWTVDHERVVKECMTGPRAVWNIAFGCGVPKGKLVYRCCFTRDCVNPVHMRLASTRKEIFAAMKASGVLKGNNVETRRANLTHAWAAAGTKVTPDSVVRAIRSAPAETTNSALASLHGIGARVVSTIRAGKSHRHVGVPE